MKHKDYYWVIILIGCILIIIAPSILTLPWRDEVLGLNTNFKSTGQIEDTIGGITAPIIGLISIILLYITFREQREFNKKQVEFNEWSSLKDMLSNTEKHLNYIVVGDILENKGNAVPKIENKSSHNN